MAYTQMSIDGAAQRKRTTARICFIALAPRLDRGDILGSSSGGRSALPSLFATRERNGLLEPRRPLSEQDGADADKMDRMRNPWRAVASAASASYLSSGNRAFDEYRTETLRRLEERGRVQDFLERLRHAKDKEGRPVHLQKPRPTRRTTSRSRAEPIGFQAKWIGSRKVNAARVKCPSASRSSA